jgi:hypothetical protein
MSKTENDNLSKYAIPLDEARTLISSIQRVVPYDVSATLRMRELAQAIQLELDQNKPDLHNIRKYAKEISCLCGLIETMRQI